MENSLRRRRTHAVRVTFVHGWISESEIWTRDENTVGGNFLFSKYTVTHSNKADGRRGKTGPAYLQRPRPFNPSFCLLSGHDLIFFSPFVFPDTLEFLKTTAPLARYQSIFDDDTNDSFVSVAYRNTHRVRIRIEWKTISWRGFLCATPPSLRGRQKARMCVCEQQSSNIRYDFDEIKEQNIEIYKS